MHVQMLQRSLKRLRKTWGYSLGDLSEKTGISKTHLWEIEMGRSSNPTLSTLHSLATVYGVSISHLLGES